MTLPEHPGHVRIMVREQDLLTAALRVASARGLHLVIMPPTPSQGDWGVGLVDAATRQVIKAQGDTLTSALEVLMAPVATTGAAS